MNMTLIEKRNNLIKKITLRLFIILFCIVVYMINTNTKQGIELMDINFMNGILASAFVWGLLELFDYILDLHSIYVQERNYFLSVYRDGLYSLKDHIQKNGTWDNKDYKINIDFVEFNNYLHQLRERLVCT